MTGAVVGKGICIVAALAAATLVTRFLPFFLFPPGRKIPEYVEYLGQTLPYATIGLLVVYCLKDVRMSGASGGMAELIAISVIIILHWKKGNALLSIGAGTAVYMALVQRVFG